MDKKKSGKKKWALLICVVALVVLAISIFLALNIGGAEKYDDSYFVSDGDKIVLTLDSNTAAFEAPKYEADTVYMVYYYSGDKVKNEKIFYKYDSKETAAMAYEVIKTEEKTWADSSKLDGQYIIFELNEDQYKDLTVTEVRARVESLE